MFKSYIRFAGYFRPHRRMLGLGLLLILLAALTEPLIPALMKQLLDRGIVQSGAAGRAVWPIWAVPVAVITLFSARALFGFGANLALSSVSGKVVSALRRDMFARVVTADSRWLGKESASSLINTLGLETIVATDSFRVVVQGAGRDLLTVLALMGYLFWMNWSLTLVTLTLLPAIALVIRLVGKRLQRIVEQQQQAFVEVNYVIEENVLANQMVKLHLAQTQQIRRFRQAVEYLRGRQMRSLAAAAAMTPITQITASFAVAVILSIALEQAQGGALSVGGFASYITAMLMLINPAKNLSDAYANVQRGRVSLERMFRLMDSPAEENKGSHAPARATGGITIKGLGKTYPGAEAPALRDVSMSIAPHTVVALVGSSGSGKSTLVQLLPRFLAADMGEIQLDGVRIEDWELGALRRQIAMVSQDFALFNDTVLANVCLGGEIDEARALKALEDAHLLDFVKSLPQGPHSVIGHDGNQLSGGQRQRLALARALYKDAPILVLDEATSALDSESEQMVQLALERLMKGRTTIVVAHRLSTIRNADCIHVMEQGRIVESGSYAQLVARNGAFARLTRAQA
jgi:subfamily B ATP-binding cassette protein MsbA